MDKSLPQNVKALAIDWAGPNPLLMQTWNDGEGTYFIVARDTQGMIRCLRVFTVGGKLYCSVDSEHQM